MKNQKLLLVGIAYAGFVLLGLSGGLLGVAWPSIQETFGLSLDAVGMLLLVSTTGYLVSSFVSGPVASRVGSGVLFVVGGVLAMVGTLGYSLAPTWWFMVLLGFLGGLGTGSIDAGLNTYFARHHRPSLMNWLHACFGLGATFGPIVMTVSLGADLSWRWSYGATGVLFGVLALAFGLTRTRWESLAPASAEAELDPSAAKIGIADTLRLPLVWLGIAIFVTYAGIETSAGQWPYSLFTEARSVAESTAGVWVSIYWGSLTVGRLFFGGVVDRLGVVRMLRLSMLGVLCGAGMVWWNGADLVSFLGLALTGLSLAPIFPLLVSITPKRVGDKHAANAIGFQVAAAGLGIGILPGLAGVLAEKLGLEIVGPFLLVTSLAMLLLHEALLRSSRRR